MAVVKPDLQKLESLLNSATSARERKMYQALLDKALQNSNKIVSVPKTKVNTPQQSTLPLKEQHHKAKQKAKQETKKKADLQKSPTKDKQKKNQTKQLKESQLEASEPKTPKSDRKNFSVKQPEDITSQTNTNKNTKAKRTSQGKDPNFFQAVGLIKSAPQIKDNKLYVTINGEEYELRRGKWVSARHFDNLKREIEENGSKEYWLRVYPKIFHDSKTQAIRYQFVLIKTFSDKSRTEHQQEDFVLRGIWQQVPFCSQPVISVYRNIEMLQNYNRLPSFDAKKSFARSQHFSVLWSAAPVEPFKYNSELKKDEQMPRYFVQVRAVFKNGQFEVADAIEEPTLDIPEYIKPPTNHKRAKKVTKK